MNSLLDGQHIELPCPHCGKKTKKLIGSVKKQKTFTCPACGKMSNLDTSGLLKGLGRVDRSLDRLKAAVKKLNG